MRINKSFTRTREIYPMCDEDLLNFFREDEIIRYNKEESIPFKEYYDQKLYLKKNDTDFIDKISELEEIHKSKKDYKTICKYTCKKGGACPLLSSCFTDLSDSSVIKITGNGSAGGNFRNSVALLDELKIYDMKDIPLDYLDTKYPRIFKPSDENKDYYKRNVARMQIDFARNEFNNKHIIEINGLKRVLNEYKDKTLIFFDFESFQYAIPLCNHIHSWEQICCQYSMHICSPDYVLEEHDFTKGIGGKIKHYEFLGDPKVDKYNSPDLSLIECLKKQLDDANVNRYAEFLKKFSKNVQFIVITHRKGTMEASDIMYGVTMEEKGVSKIVSIDLEK